MAESPLSELVDVYDSLVDWPKRLAREEPFYRGLFESVGVSSVVDVACGTGRHAAMFHGWGQTVEGADIDPDMIDRARNTFGQPKGLCFVVRGFAEPIRPEKPFGAAICVGNSLALAPDTETVARAIREMLAAVRPGGVAVVHVLNLWRLPDGPCVWQKCRRVALPQGEVMVAKGVHRSGNRGFVDLVVAPLEAPSEASVRMRTESVPLLGLDAGQLEQMAADAGAIDVRRFGGYENETYHRDQSVDLIVVATKG